MPKLLIISIIFIILVAIVIIVVEFLKEGTSEEKDEKPKYQYKRKQFFMSRPEHELFDILVSIIGNDYLIFAQVHLPTFLDHKIKGQNWHGAFRHIDEKSVDFVLCDKSYVSPKLIIELDDKSHDRSDRVERDVEVERILKQAGVPLLRLENHGNFNPNELKDKITKALS
jgi:very-short-patch-repair endonuclease